MDTSRQNSLNEFLRKMAGSSPQGEELRATPSCHWKKLTEEVQGSDQDASGTPCSSPLRVFIDKSLPEFKSATFSSFLFSSLLSHTVLCVILRRFDRQQVGDKYFCRMYKSQGSLKCCWQCKLSLTLNIHDVDSRCQNKSND